MTPRPLSSAEIGIIGGSGLYAFEGLEDQRSLEIDTPYGKPSGPIVTGALSHRRVAFVPRHGEGHRIGPSEIPARANIWALKSLGVERVISVSAVGSLQEGIHPLDFVIPDQLIDRTRARQNTFFGDGVVAHVPFADPVCPGLGEATAKALEASGAAVTRGGTCVVMEGPAFSTRAESFLYRSWGASVIGMTALPEAKLAREAELCYAVMAAVTDYDSWHETEADVTVAAVVANLERNVATAQRGIAALLGARLPERRCPCPGALDHAIITSADAIPPERKEALSVIAGRHFDR